jgi:hypothetical protein
VPNVLVPQGLEQLARAAVAGLWESGVLVGTTYRDAESSLVQGRGDTVTIKSPQSVAAAQFTGTTTITDVVHGKISIVMDLNPYSQVQLTQRERTLYIEQLASEVVVPQTQGIVSFIDAAIAAKLNTTTGVAGSTAALGWPAAIANAREVLTVNQVPTSDRWLACAPDVVTGLLNSTVVQSGNLSDAGSALANGFVGRYMGFNLVESGDIAPATAFAYHRTAVCSIFRTPVAPEGGAVSGSSSLRGISAQVLYSFSSSALADLITVQTLGGLGVSTVDFDARCLKVTLAP